MSRNTIFKLFALALAFALLIPELVQHGMFMDGVQYAIVSKNLALGKGTFWFPYLSASWNRMYSNAFLEHLPLTYYLQSKFFLLFGDGVFTEKIYCFCAAFTCAFLIYKIWILLFKEDTVLHKYWWLAVLLWFVTPSVFWSFANNMMENTVSVMVLAACYFCLKAIHNNRYSIINIFISAVFVFLASLSKGLPGLFPIGFVICYYSVFKTISFKKTLLYTSILIFVPALIYLVIYKFNHNGALSILFYIENRLLNRIYSEHTVDNRFTILFWLFTDLLVNIGLTVLLILLFKLKTFVNPLTKTDTKFILLFSLFGICGVLPLCLTHVQRATYFVPALSFFGIAFAVFLARGIDYLINIINEKAFKIIKIIVITISIAIVIISVSLIGKTSRDVSLLSDTHKIGEAIGRNKNIGSPFEIYTKWDLQFYLLRYYDITLYAFPERKHDYKLFDKTYVTDTINDYKKVNVDLEKYVLIKRNSN